MIESLAGSQVYQSSRPTVLSSAPFSFNTISRTQWSIAMWFSSLLLGVLATAALVSATFSNVSSPSLFHVQVPRTTSAADSTGSTRASSYADSVAATVETKSSYTGQITTLSLFGSLPRQKHPATPSSAPDSSDATIQANRPSLISNASLLPAQVHSSGLGGSVRVWNKKNKTLTTVYFVSISSGLPPSSSTGGRPVRVPRFTSHMKGSWSPASIISRTLSPAMNITSLPRPLVTTSERRRVWSLSLNAAASRAKSAAPGTSGPLTQPSIYPSLLTMTAPTWSMPGMKSSARPPTTSATPAATLSPDELIKASVVDLNLALKDLVYLATALLTATKIWDCVDRVRRRRSRCATKAKRAARTVNVCGGHLACHQAIILRLKRRSRRNGWRSYRHQMAGSRVERRLLRGEVVFQLL